MANSVGSAQDRQHDRYVAICVKEAIAAAREGNFGVGACLVNPEGEVVVRGHNRMFWPYFRSDMHAEMIVMSQWEDDHPEVKAMDGFSLFTSLEPCPMCTVRLLNSGVSHVLFGAVDLKTGLATRATVLGPSWALMSSGDLFSQADCSDILRDVALGVFLVTGNECVDKLRKRRGLCA